MKYRLSVWIFSNNIYCLSLLFSFTTDLLTIQDLYMHTRIGGDAGLQNVRPILQSKKNYTMSLRDQMRCLLLACVASG